MLSVWSPMEARAFTLQNKTVYNVLSDAVGNLSKGDSNTSELVAFNGYYADCHISFKCSYTLNTNNGSHTYTWTCEQPVIREGAKTLELLSDIVTAAWNDSINWTLKPFKSDPNIVNIRVTDVNIWFDNIEESYVNAGDVTRHFGYEVYKGYVTVSKSGATSITEDDVVAGFMAGNYTKQSLGAVKKGGKDDTRPMSNISSEAGTLADKIESFIPGPVENFITPFGYLFNMSDANALKAQIASANKEVQLPYVAVTLAMSARRGSASIANIIRGGYNPWSMTFEQGKSYFASKEGGDSLVTSIVNGRSTNIKITSDGTPVMSVFVFPFGEGIPVDSSFIFGVESTPKNNSTIWSDPDSTRQGTFTINVQAAAPTAIDPNTEYTIAVTAEKVDAMYDSPYLGTVNIPVIEEKKVKGSDLVKEKPEFIKFDVTGGSPQDSTSEALNKGVLKINVTIKGGPEDKQAAFSPTLSDKDAVGSGIDGYNYVAWQTFIPELEPPIDGIFLVPWAQHSAVDPLVNGTLGASEYGNEDWETGTGIPSTENVYVLAGGETALSDLAGYFVIHASGGGVYSEIYPVNQGENEPGESSGNPSVTREIMLTCSVQNTWGYNNTLCHRTANPYDISGGEVKDTGGGKGWSCNGGSPHITSCSIGMGNGNGKHCQGDHTKGNQNDVEAWGPCPWHGTKWSYGSGNHSYDCTHATCGNSHVTCGWEQDDNGISHPKHDGCSEEAPNSDSPQTVGHNCTWSFTLYDGDKNDSVNIGVTSDAASDLPRSFELTTNGAWVSLSEGNISIQNYIPGANNDKGAAFWKNAVMDISTNTNTTAYIKGSVKFTQQANQYFHLEGSFTVGNNADGDPRTAHPNVGGCAHFNSSWDDWTTSGGIEHVVLSSFHDKKVELCNGYSYGTGTNCTGQENCYHMFEHNYTLKYLERIDFYTFRTVTDAHLAAMRGSEVASVNQVTCSGYEELNGTFAAPIDWTAVGESVTAPESIGYLWRCCNSKYGSYINGTELSTNNGEYNGRILFEIWKEPEAGASGALSYKFNPNFCLGNAKITAVLKQDHEFANNSIVESQYDNPQFIFELPKSSPTRGMDNDRYHHTYVTSKERGKGSGAEYAQNNYGDCLTKNFNASSWDESQAANELGEERYYKLIIAEQNAIVNYWQGMNKDDNYHALIISDNMCYGGNTNTTQVIGEYYSVDEGIPLFNYLAGKFIKRTSIDYDEGPIYRNHHSMVGSTKDELAMFIANYNCPMAPSMNEGDHYGYFGFGGVGDGGNMPLADSLTGKCVAGTVYEVEFGNKGSWVPGPDVIDAYRRKLGSKVPCNSSTNMSGITEFQSYLPNQPTPGGDSFEGYWNDHNYPAHVSETVCGRVNGSMGETLAWEDIADFEFTGTNSGTLNQQQYGQSMLMHNMPLIDWTPNGFWPTVELSNSYGWLLDMESIGSVFAPVRAKLNENGVYDKHKNIITNKLGKSIPEKIRIYDPISAEFSYNIGNQYGNWSGDEDRTPDTSDHDQRTTSIGKAKNDFAAVGNYVCPNTYLWTWIAPFGNFSSVGGSSGSGSDVTTAEVHRNMGNRGYMDDMYIGTWTKTVKINYPFVAKARFKTKVSQEFFIDELDNVYGSGNSNYMEAEYGPDKLQNFYTSIENPIFRFGNAVGAKCTVDLDEGRNLPVVITAYAINDGIQSDFGSCFYGETVNSNGNNSDKWCNAATKRVPIDLVGNIGNLAIHDTTDFRLSTYFKKQIDDSWLIDGIVLNTDEKEPVHILSTPNDILFQPAENKVYKHSTLGVTDMNAPNDGDTGKGMAGDFGLLPLTPAYITIDEFKTDALRLGYKVYASIETIGNYDAVHYPGVKYPTNYDQAQDPSNDTRTEYLEIISEYYLYDFDDGKFYAIDLWSGPQGAKQCIYSGYDRKVHPQLNSEPLYINLDEEFYRRNVSDLEDYLTRTSYRNGGEDDTSIYTALMSGLEFIGYTGYIKLDTMDLTYCGSDAVQGIEAYNENLSQKFTGYSNASQRWHFTSGLTSTTTPTMPVYKDGITLTATQVENAYRDLRTKHPNAVIVEFQNYIAKGDVWTLKYNGSLMNTKTINFYSKPEDCPYDEKSHITDVEYQGYPVYNPDTGEPYGSQTIDKDSTPLVAYEAYKSNAEDRTVSGTH